VFAAGMEAGVEQARDFLLLDRAEADAAGVGRDFDQRLQPEHAARAVAHELDVDAARLCLLGNGGRGFIGAQRQRVGIARNVDSDGHCTPRFAWIRRLNFSFETRAYRSSSIWMVGPVAHWPRQ